MSAFDEEPVVCEQVHSDDRYLHFSYHETPYEVTA